MQARKKNFLGDKGSATDWKKIAEFEKANKLAEQALKKLEKQKKEALLGINEGHLMDSFLAALEKGKDAMSSFEEGFDDMIRKIFLNKIKTQYLEKQLGELWEDISQKAESGGVSTRANSTLSGARRKKFLKKLGEGLSKRARY